MFIFFWKKMMKMLHALRAKGSSRHARAHHLTSIFFFLVSFEGSSPSHNLTRSAFLASLCV